MADTAEAGASTNHVSQIRPKLAKSLMDSSEIEPKSKVLVIYTGGTIGMKTNEKGGLQKIIKCSFFLKVMLTILLNYLSGNWVCVLIKLIAFWNLSRKKKNHSLILRKIAKEYCVNSTKTKEEHLKLSNSNIKNRFFIM